MKRRVVLKSYSSRAAAEAARSALDANGVESFVVSDDSGAQYPALGFVRGVDLLVDSEQLARAKKVLTSVNRTSKKRESMKKRSKPAKRNR